MAGGNDLNLLKSWNPKLSKNRSKVKQREKELLTEEINLQQQIKERNLSDLANKKSKTGLEWMYEDVDVSTTQIEKTKNDPSPNTKQVPKVVQQSNKKKVVKVQKYDRDDPMSKLKVARKKHSLTK